MGKQYKYHTIKKSHGFIIHKPSKDKEGQNRPRGSIGALNPIIPRGRPAAVSEVGGASRDVCILT